jgi:putative glutamine amidotransferase
MRVNSFHHQAVKQLAPGFIATAMSPDGVVEAIELDSGGFVVGVQWHPEDLEDFASRALFEALVISSRLQSSR